MHLNGKKHQSKLLLPVLSAKLFYAQQKKPENKLPELCLAPGEPVPPGFEGEVKGVAELQATLDDCKSPLIGLEYLTELIGDQKEPQYVCNLCDKRGDPRTVMAHLTSYNHRLWYLENHFPTVYKSLWMWRNNKEYKKLVPTVVQNIAEAIEIKYGRTTPFIVDKDLFEANKKKYYDEAVNDKHFSEKNGPTFINLVNKQVFEELKQKQLEEEKIKKDKENELAKRKIELSIENSSEKKSKFDAAESASKVYDDKKNYDDISSISSSSSKGSRSRSRSRTNRPTRIYNARSRSREYNRKYPVYRDRGRSRSRSYSPVRYSERYYRSNNYRSRSRSNSRTRSTSRNRLLHKSYDRDLYRKPRRLWETSMGRGGYTHEKSEKRINVPSAARPSTDTKRQIAPTPKELVQQASKLSAERYNLEKYRFAVEIMESEMEKVLASHEKSPEKHPLYPDEWKKFWNRRYKELQAENKDPAKHDFKTEWIKFWTERMKQLHKEEIESKRVKLREKYNIKENAEEQSVNNLKEQYILKVKPSCHIDSEIIVLDDDRVSDRQSGTSQHSENKRAPSRSLKSASPWDDDDDFDVKSRVSRASSKRIVHETGERNKTYDEWAKDYYGPNKSKTTFIRELHTSNEQYPALDPSESLNIVSVLRLLTALEDVLGSLGPKIINMLSTALAMEKNKANSAEDLLLNDANSVMFETVKEKLKGQLFAGILDTQKIQPVKTAIQKIATLLHQASEKQKQNEEEERKALAAKKLEPVSVPGVGAVDKAAIAKQIANALMAQGKPNVTTDELEQLINAVVGMAGASQASSKPLTTAAYLAQLQNTKLVDEVITEDTEKSKIIIEDDIQDKKDPMDGLSDSDLKTLLQNFSNLSNDEQHGLIMYLKKLEAREPERVENLRKFVNVEQFESVTENKIDKSDTFQQNSGRSSPFSNREGVTNPSSEITFNNSNSLSKSSDENTKFEEHHLIESDDEDYSYEDVFKAASKNVKEKQLQKDMKLIKDTITRDRESANTISDKDMTLVDATSLIANLMRSLQNKSDNIRPSSESLEQTTKKSDPNIPQIANTTVPYDNSLEASNSRNYPDPTLDLINLRPHSNSTLDTSNIRINPSMSNIRGSSTCSDPHFKMQPNSLDNSGSYSDYSDLSSSRINPNFSNCSSMRLNPNTSDLSNVRLLGNSKNTTQFNQMNSGPQNSNRTFSTSFLNDRDSNFMQTDSLDKNAADLHGNNSYQNSHTNSFLSGNLYDQNKFRDSNCPPGQSLQQSYNQQYGRSSYDLNNFNSSSNNGYGGLDQSRYSRFGGSNLEQRFSSQVRQSNIDNHRFSLLNQDYNNRNSYQLGMQRYGQNNNRFPSRGGRFN